MTSNTVPVNSDAAKLLTGKSKLANVSACHSHSATLPIARVVWPWKASGLLGWAFFRSGQKTPRWKGWHEGKSLPQRMSVCCEALSSCKGSPFLNAFDTEVMSRTKRCTVWDVLFDAVSVQNLVEFCLQRGAESDSPSSCFAHFVFSNHLIPWQRRCTFCSFTPVLKWQAMQSVIMMKQKWSLRGADLPSTSVPETHQSSHAPEKDSQEECIHFLALHSLDEGQICCMFHFPRNGQSRRDLPRWFKDPHAPLVDEECSLVVELHGWEFLLNGLSSVKTFVVLNVAMGQMHLFQIVCVWWCCCDCEDARCSVWQMKNSQNCCELTVGARLHSVADRQHFELNLLASPHNAWGAGRSTFWQSCRVWEAKLTLKAFKLCAADSKLVKQIAAGGASQCTPSTWSPPMPHHSEPVSAPHQLGPKDTFL